MDINVETSKPFEVVMSIDDSTKGWALGAVCLVIIGMIIYRKATS